METVPDRIEKQAHLRAPRARVWSAMTDSRKFGVWFGCELEGPFVAGRRVKGRMRPTQMDPEVAQQQEAYTGTPFELLVEQVEPERLFSFRWYVAGEPTPENPNPPTTLVAFELEATPEGTLLRISESGFSKVPLDKREALFTGNADGWAKQLKLIERYLQVHGA